jgi:hypothetical protein
MSTGAAVVTGLAPTKLMCIGVSYGIGAVGVGATGSVADLNTTLVVFFYSRSAP